MTTPLELANAEIASLRARISDLEADLAYADSLVAFEHREQDAVLLWRAWRLSPQQIRLLLTLHCAYPRTVNKDVLHDALRVKDESLSKVVDVRVCQTRRQLGFDTIENTWGRGYALTAKGKSLIDAALAKAA